MLRIYLLVSLYIIQMYSVIIMEKDIPVGNMDAEVADVEAMDVDTNLKYQCKMGRGYFQITPSHFTFFVELDNIL